MKSRGLEGRLSQLANEVIEDAPELSAYLGDLDKTAVDYFEDQHRHGERVLRQCFARDTLNGVDSSDLSDLARQELDARRRDLEVARRTQQFNESQSALASSAAGAKSKKHRKVSSEARHDADILMHRLRQRHPEKLKKQLVLEVQSAIPELSSVDFKTLDNRLQEPNYACYTFGPEVFESLDQPENDS